LRLENQFALETYKPFIRIHSYRNYRDIQCPPHIPKYYRYRQRGCQLRSRHNLSHVKFILALCGHFRPTHTYGRPQITGDYGNFSARQAVSRTGSSNMYVTSGKLPSSPFEWLGSDKKGEGPLGPKWATSLTKVNIYPLILFIYRNLWPQRHEI